MKGAKNKLARADCISATSGSTAVVIRGSSFKVFF
jgi:hypothetical protein